ncbi:hypothetical protein TWF788_003239 [Orbilia oligospora]|uniref:Uncharacterized protein n=1 Tax=Orbilia oligospora TaxID=2813651 RepID=A0A7C8PZV1_ORBOL|nr:hypothetical protein TWF788_003239 [Orbilia oligospora]
MHQSYWTNIVKRHRSGSDSDTLAGDGIPVFAPIKRREHWRGAGIKQQHSHRAEESHLSATRDQVFDTNGSATKDMPLVRPADGSSPQLAIIPSRNYEIQMPEMKCNGKGESETKYSRWSIAGPKEKLSLACESLPNLLDDDLDDPFDYSFSEDDIYYQDSAHEYLQQLRFPTTFQENK